MRDSIRLIIVTLGIALVAVFLERRVRK